MKTPNGIMGEFIRKVNQKVNLLDDTRPDLAILKDGFLKTRPIKKFQISFKNVVLQTQLWNACRCL